MSEERWLRYSEWWLRLLLRVYPVDFRYELGQPLMEAYRDRFRTAFRQGGIVLLGWVCLRALADSLRNGLRERLRPAVARGRFAWGRDAELVVRRLARAPVFVATIVGTVTVGLGTFAVVLTVVDKVLIEPLPYERPEDLYFVWRDYGPIFDVSRGRVAGTDVAALGAARGVIESAVGLDWATPTLSGGVHAQPEEVAVMISSAGLFELLGVKPALGRGFTANEAGPGREPVIVLGHDLWSRRFGADSSMVGSEVLLDGEPFTVIGVMERSFRFERPSSLGPPQRADAYITIDQHLAKGDPRAAGYLGLVRALPGTAAERLIAAVDAVGESVDERHFGDRGLRLYAVGMKTDLVSAVRPALVVLGTTGVFLVLVLLLNLATLLLVRAAEREREFAISRALGANPLALARGTLLEGGVLGMLGGAGGALVAVWGTRVLVALAPLDFPRRETIAVDWGLAGVVIGIGALLGLLAGALPATWAMRSGPSTLLGNAAARAGVGRGRLRRGIVVVQVALSLVLLSAGGLVARSFERMLRADPGFEAAGVLTLRIPVPESRYPEGAAKSLHDRIARELAALPGVTAVGAASALPLSGGGGRVPVAFPGAPGNTGNRERDRPVVDHIRTRRGYFDALGIRLLEGSVFDAAPPDGVREALIDRTLATRFFPTGSPLGATLVVGGDSLTVIGVVDHARLHDIHQDGRPQIYIRNDDYTARTLSWVVRTRRPPVDLVPGVGAAIRRIDPQLALADVRSMQEIVDGSMRQQRLSAALIGGFSLGALLLAAMGLFGVVSGSVTRRRHELAVRLALGADHGRVLRLVLHEGARLIGLGLLIGVPGIYLSGQVIRGVLVGVSPFDPLTLGVVASGLALIALGACYVPARRVAGIEPALSLRQE